MMQEALDAIAALVAERDALRCDLDRIHHALKDAGVHPGRTDEPLTSVIGRLAAERDAAVADAERYRWLRSGACPFTISRYDKRPAEHYFGTAADAAIDAARQNTEKP
jgi:hypothetical protein